jgi:hypothetical protein
LSETTESLEVHKDAVKNFNINRKEKEDWELIFQIKITIQVSLVFKAMYDLWFFGGGGGRRDCFFTVFHFLREYYFLNKEN